MADPVHMHCTTLTIIITLLPNMADLANIHCYLVTFSKCTNATIMHYVTHISCIYLFWMWSVVMAQQGLSQGNTRIPTFVTHAYVCPRRLRDVRSSVHSIVLMLRPCILHACSSAFFSRPVYNCTGSMHRMNSLSPSPASNLLVCISESCIVF